MRRRSSSSRRVRRVVNEDAVEHMRQRRELSRLVHGLDNEVLAIFFRLDSRTFERMATTYELLFGHDAVNYMRETLPAWRAGTTGVSGLNAARLMTVVPHFLTDEQRDILLGKLRAVMDDAAVASWIRGQDSTVREQIKTIARPRRGASLSPLPAKTIPPPPSKLELACVPRVEPPRSIQPAKTFVMNAVLANTPKSDVPVQVGRRSNPLVGYAWMYGLIGFVILLGIVLNSPSASRPSVQIVSVPAVSAPAPSGAAPRTTTESTNDAFFAASRERVRERYPDALNPTTLLGTRVRREYDVMAAANDPDLHSPDAPMIVAERATRSLGLDTGSTAQVTPVPQVKGPQLLEVKFVRKPNRPDVRTRIEQIGGTNPNGTLWALPLDDAIARMQSGKYAFYTEGKGGRAKVQIATSRSGNLMLKTTANGTQKDNLLSLPDFPNH